MAGDASRYLNAYLRYSSAYGLQACGLADALEKQRKTAGRKPYKSLSPARSNILLGIKLLVVCRILNLE